MKQREGFMNSIKLSVFLVMSALLIVSCGSTKVNLATKNLSKSSGDVLRIEGNWIKNKHDKFDISVSLINTTNKEIIVKRADMTCKKGTHLGYYDRIRNEHTNISSNNPQYLAFGPEETKRFHLTCELGGEYEGKDFYFIVKRIFENKSKDFDLPTTGKVLANDVELHIKLN